MTNPDPNTNRAGDNLSRLSCRLGLAVIAIAFVLAAALSWRKWPDPLVDFGTQLYIPWRLLHGAVLYRDLFYFAGGPFSQYFNALLFKIFGVSFSTLITANLFLTAAMLYVVYRRFQAAADVWTATLIGLAIVFVFAFSEFTPIGNYDDIAPYSHETFHGLVLSIFTMTLLSDWVATGKLWTAAAAGLLAGLVFLAKPDIFMALMVPVIASAILFRLKHGQTKFLKCSGSFLAAAIVPSLFFLLYFLTKESPGDSLHTLLFGWTPLFNLAVTKNPFYLWCMGLETPGSNAREIALSFLAVVLAVVVYSLLLRLIWKLNSTIARYLIALLLLAPALAWATRYNWIECGWPLPLLSLCACALTIWNYRRQTSAFPLLWSLFGMALLMKLGLFPRIWHYGFALAMPAFVTSIYLLVSLLPSLIEKKFSVPARPFQIIAGVTLLVGFYGLFAGSQSVYAQKNTAVGTAGDKMVILNLNSDKGQAIYAALAWADKYMPTNATLAVVPEGVMLNYLTRRANPTPCLFWDPNCMAVFGQSTMTEEFEKKLPDYIFIVSTDYSQFNAGNFGDSPAFGQALMQWIGKNYQPLFLIGHEPLENGPFGIKILKRLAIPKAAQIQSGGFNASKSSSSFGDRKFTPTSKDASVQPKPSDVM